MKLINKLKDKLLVKNHFKVLCPETQECFNVQFIEPPSGKLENLNVSILDANVENFIQEDQKPEQSNDKLLDFKNLFEKISTKYEQVGDVFKHMRRRSNISSNKKSTQYSRNYSCSIAYPELFTNLSPHFNNLKMNKEVCFKISPISKLNSSSNSNLKVENFRHFVLNKKMIVGQSKDSKYPQGIVQIYKKYFKYEDNFLNDTMSSRVKKIPMLGDSQWKNQERKGHQNKFHLNKFKETMKEKVKFMQYMNSSVYLKNVMGKSGWMKN